MSPSSDHSDVGDLRSPDLPITRSRVPSGGCRPFFRLLLQTQHLHHFDPWATQRFPLGHPRFSTGPPNVFHWATQGFAWATQASELLKCKSRLSPGSSALPFPNTKYNNQVLAPRLRRVATRIKYKTARLKSSKIFAAIASELPKATAKNQSPTPNCNARM